MKRFLVPLAVVAAALIATAAALAQSGHFIEQGAGAPTCVDIGTQVQCTAKVAGLGGTTFEIRIAAEGVASVTCFNPAGNPAPGQDTAVSTAGTTGPLPTPKNGQYTATITTDEPAPLPPTPTCPNEMWTPVITDVTFSSVTLTLFEDDVLSDTFIFTF